MQEISLTQFKEELFALEKYYHIYHPCNIALNTGKCQRTEVQRWVANRYYYQINIPIKDAAIISNCHDRDIRREWLNRIITHDGCKADEGGIEAWLRLGIACGLTRKEITSEALLLPGVKFAVDAYVNFARTATWQEGICASLTELFAPKIHAERLKNWPQFYPWIAAEGLQYFKNRLNEAPKDVGFSLQHTLHYFHKTAALQKRAKDILKFKLNILWSISDAIYLTFKHENVGEVV